MRSRVRLMVALLSAGCLVTPSVLCAQTPLSLDHFDGWEAWPLYEPGQLPIANTQLAPLRIEFAGLFPGANGFGRQPLDSLTMYMDVIESRFHGALALWIQWLSKPPASSSGSPALDALLVDRATFRLLFRLAASQRGNWAGQYELVQPQAKQLVQVTVQEDGTTEKHTLEASNFFDFATYQFLFPLLDLHEGMAFRLSGYEYIEKRAEILPVKVVGRTRVADAGGRMHNVWQVDIMPEHRATLITFYVSQEAPYFYGWDYRVVRDGSMAIQLRLRGWMPTSIR